MRIGTTLEQLEQVEKSLSAIEPCYDVTLNGKRVTPSTLSAIEALEEKLLARYKGADQEPKGGIFRGFWRWLKSIKIRLWEALNK